MWKGFRGLFGNYFRRVLCRLQRLGETSLRRRRWTVIAQRYNDARESGSGIRRFHVFRFGDSAVGRGY
jgi:hypothetical protein